MSLDARRLRRFLWAGLGLVVLACIPEYTFVPEPSCENGSRDEGETDVDCGGDECDPCQAGDTCSLSGDCASEVCVEGRCAAPMCDDRIRNGTETDRDCGGGQCDGCETGSPCNEPADCLSGICTGEPGAKLCEISCADGTAECDGDTDVECETNLLSDPLHCGDCETVCELVNAVQSCVSGRCMIASCEEPYDDCNNEDENEIEDGCETNLLTAATHCGACGTECSAQNGTPSCENAECQIECDDGFWDCDDSRANGCEQNIGTDVLNCGECERECPYEEGETPFCVEGECGATICPDGFGNCDGRGDTCEKDLTTDVMHCGRCGGECTVFRGTPSCDEDGCAIEDCEDGFENCNTSDPDGGYMDGCETNTDADSMNCGVCGLACTTENGTGTCVNGECRVMTCEDGWFNCDSGNSDGGFANGCETNIDDDETNCGVCGRDCDELLASANATGQCTNGICERDQCLPNFGDCDTNPNNCESDFRSDEGDCGNCDTACAPTGTNSEGNECVSGTCTPTCDATHANCDTTGPNGCEINTTNDNMHCGGCNMPCGTGRTCVGSQCVCSGGFTSCSGTCVNTTNNNTHCGMCNNACTGGRTCVNSVCQCPSGQTFCGSTCVDTQTNAMHCGQCNRQCQTPAGTPTNPCTGGQCQPDCTGTLEDCDSEPWDGCEADLATSGTDCGMCGRACQFGSGTNVTPASQAGNACSGSVCMPSCVSGFASCDSEPWDGCETDITTVTNCGQCSRDCADAACGSTGSTSCCVLSGTTRNCQAQITIANDVDASVVGGSLSFMHALQPGTNRLILLAVVSEVGGGGATASRPDVVTYGGTAMTAGTEQSGGAGFWSPDLFFYYLTESGIGTKTGSQTVVVNGTPSSPNPGSPSVIIANLVQLSGVRQTNPLGPYVGGALPSDGDADRVTQTLAVATSGSRIYTLTAGMFCPGSALDPYLTNGTTPTTLLNNTGVSGSGVDMRAAGAYAGSGAATVLAGGPSVMHTVGWDYAFCGEITHEAVVVSPAAQ